MRSLTCSARAISRAPGGGGRPPRKRADGSSAASREARRQRRFEAGRRFESAPSPQDLAIAGILAELSKGGPATLAQVCEAERAGAGTMRNRGPMANHPSDVRIRRQKLRAGRLFDCREEGEESVAARAGGVF